MCIQAILRRTQIAFQNEYQLLIAFVENPNRTFTREQLIEAALALTI